MSDVFKSFKRSGQHAVIVATLPDASAVARLCNAMKGKQHIGCLLLPSNTPSVDNGDGTYTHTYMTHQLRYIDPRITHQSDDRQAKPV